MNNDKNFDNWLKNLKDSIATWNYYIDFKKVYKNVDEIKVELNILNSLIASKNIENDFRDIVLKYPGVLKAIPILLAKREYDIKIIDAHNEYNFNFIKMNYSLDQYVLFMRNSGLFDLLENHIINNLVDYVMGVEVGMDTNGRKNRTGDVMEDIVESYLINSGLKKDKTYFKEMYASEIEKRFDIDLSSIRNNGKGEKRFDFVFVGALNRVYAIECNFYSGGGSKLNETARSYKTLALEAKSVENFSFVWITDGKGWESAKKNLLETYEVMDNLYNIKDLENGVINRLVDNDEYLKVILSTKIC
ncbi:MAG TPA: restriction endonuclease [Firmicutes bacterium]|nr:restriction endonuclease [Bacillota bacterium]